MNDCRLIDSAAGKGRIERMQDDGPDIDPEQMEGVQESVKEE